MSWEDDPELTEPDDGYDEPILGVTGGQRARAGDTYTLEFHDDGEEVDTDNGRRVAFGATLKEASFAPIDGDQEPIENGDDVRFMTGSARFLSVLKDHTPVDGKELEIEIAGTGYNAEYLIDEA